MGKERKGKRKKERRGQVVRLSASEGRGEPSVPAGLRLGRLGWKLQVKLKGGDGGSGGREGTKWYKAGCAGGFAF